jgi:hypothetical protein
MSRKWAIFIPSRRSIESRMADSFLRLLLIANVTSLEIQVTGLLTPYATSAYGAHSLVSTIAVVQGIVSCKSSRERQLITTILIL